MTSHDKLGCTRFPNAEKTTREKSQIQRGSVIEK